MSFLQTFALCLLAAIAIACFGSDPKATEMNNDRDDQPLKLSDAINSHCPRSGKPVVASSLTTYRGYTVGFCNQHCRDDFARDIEAAVTDRAFFDETIAKINHVDRPLKLADAINKLCPRSGKPVVANSLTKYRGYTVGFCNSHCRDDFARDIDAAVKDRAVFDAAISKRNSQ